MTYDNISSQYQNYRRIALIVVHCSATRADRSFPVEALRRCHVQERGFADIGYHFYITRDGITHVCRPIDHIGAHARCFNDHSIGVCYEGGLDEQGQPADTRTMEQKNRADSTVAATSAGLSEAALRDTMNSLRMFTRHALVSRQAGNIRIYKIVSISGRLPVYAGAFYDYLP